MQAQHNPRVMDEFDSYGWLFLRDLQLTLEKLPLAD
jgi:hypothetical protein